MQHVRRSRAVRIGAVFVAGLLVVGALFWTQERSEGHRPRTVALDVPDVDLPASRPPGAVRLTPPPVRPSTEPGGTNATRPPSAPSVAAEALPVPAPPPSTEDPPSSTVAVVRAAPRPPPPDEVETPTREERSSATGPKKAKRKTKTHDSDRRGRRGAGPETP